MKQSTYGPLTLTPYREGWRPFVETFDGFTSHLWRDPRTGHCRFDPVPPPDVLDRFYNGTFTRSAAPPTPESEFRPEIIDAVKGVQGYLRDVAGLDGAFTVHDYGCGFGAGVWAWQQIGISASGNEANQAWVDAANPHCRGALSTAPLADALSGRAVDLFFSSHVLEHVPDPLADMATIARHLSDRGVAYINVPNGICETVMVRGRRDGTDYGNFPMHLNFFTPRSIVAMFRSVDLEVVQMETRPLHELPKRADDPTWRELCLTEFHGGELFVLVSQPGNMAVRRMAGLDDLMNAAHDRFMRSMATLPVRRMGRSVAFRGHRLFDLARR